MNNATERYWQESLPLSALPQDGYALAHTDLVYDPSVRLNLDERFDLVAKMLADSFGLNRSNLELGPAPEGEMSGWLNMLTIKPRVLAAYLGLKIVLPSLDNAEQVARAAKDYCQMAWPLVQHLPNRRPHIVNWLRSRLENGLVLLHPTAAQRWGARSTQEQNQPLVVSQMLVNPATWYGYDDRVYSLSSDNVCALTPPDIQIGELVGFCSVARTEPWVVEGIVQENAPCTDISGCRVFFDGRWSYSPYCHRDDGGAWLDVGLSASAGGGGYGSLLLRE